MQITKKYQLEFIVLNNLKSMIAFYWLSVDSEIMIWKIKWLNLNERLKPLQNDWWNEKRIESGDLRDILLLEDKSLIKQTSGVEGACMLRW